MVQEDPLGLGIDGSRTDFTSLIHNATLPIFESEVTLIGPGWLPRAESINSIGPRCEAEKMVKQYSPEVLMWVCMLL